MNFAAIKTQCENLWNLTFDFYKEPIALWKTPKEIFVSSNPNIFNPFYSNNSVGANVSYQPQSGVFWGTFEEIALENANQYNLYDKENPSFTSDASARLTLETGALDFFKDFEKVVVDGREYQKLTDVQFRGPFIRSQFNIWLKPLNPKI